MTARSIKKKNTKAKQAVWCGFYIYDEKNYDD